MSSGAATAMPQPGDVVAGKYAVTRVLGEGGMGVVYEAMHLRLRQPVALKLLLPELQADPVVVSRFEREARAAAQLKSRHVARVLDVDVTETGLPYLVMELLRGYDVHAELVRKRVLAPAEAADVLVQACAAMIEAHQAGIVHRDLKPSNLFLADVDGETIVKVLDFGISKLQEETDAKLTGVSALGTAVYMSPEQVRASATVDARTDVWALGVILYELLTGEPPWVGSPTQVSAAIVTADPPELKGVAPELVAIVSKCMRRAPEDRFTDARALARALAPFTSPKGPARAIVESLGRGAVTATSAGEARAAKRPPMLLVVGGTFVVGVLVLGGAGILWLRTQPPIVPERAPVSATTPPVVAQPAASSAPVATTPPSASVLPTTQPPPVASPRPSSRRAPGVRPSTPIAPAPPAPSSPAPPQPPPENPLTL